MSTKPSGATLFKEFSTCEVCSRQLVLVVETEQERHYWGEILGKESLKLSWLLRDIPEIVQDKWLTLFSVIVINHKPSLAQVCSHLTRLSYTELQPGSSHGSGAEHPEAVVSRGSERPFHTAADHPFIHTHDQGLKQRLTHTLGTLQWLFQEALKKRPTFPLQFKTTL